jgi:hypothetical protein
LGHQIKISAMKTPNSKNDSPGSEQQEKTRENLPGFKQLDLLGYHYMVAQAHFGQGHAKEAEDIIKGSLGEYHAVKGDDRSAFRYEFRSIWQFHLVPRTTEKLIHIDLGLQGSS